MISKIAAVLICAHLLSRMQPRPSLAINTARAVQAAGFVLDHPLVRSCI